MSDFGGSTQDRTADPPDYRSGCSEPVEHQKAIKSKFLNKELKTKKSLNERLWWKHTGSNRGPSACKADALNQLSYASKICISKELFFPILVPFSTVLGVQR